MAVTERTDSAEQKAENENSRAEAEAKTKKGILDSLDLSAEVEKFGTAGEGEEEQKLAKKKAAAEEESEEAEESEESEEKAEGEEEAEGEEGSEEESEEGEEEAEGDETEDDDDLTPEEGEEGDEVVSKKKVQKRISSLNARNKALAEENARLKGQKDAEAEETDPDVKKLNAMTQDGLKATRRAVIVAIAKATREGDDEKVEKLVDLQDKVETAMQTAPQRFMTKQVNAYNQVADEISSLGEIKMTKESAAELKAIAREVYQSNPELHTLVNGQALALKHAYALYKATLSKTAEKGKTVQLKRENNTLKRKTSLDSGGLKKKASKGAEVSKLRKDASHGDTNAKINLIKNDPAFGLDSLIPEEYKEE